MQPKTDPQPVGVPLKLWAQSALLLKLLVAVRSGVLRSPASHIATMPRTLR